MNIRPVLFLISSFLFLFIGFASEKQNGLDYEIIEDLSTLSQKVSERSTLKIVLPNGIKTLLISDPSLCEAAASISIEAGTWDDPEKHPGMAHFVEHLLFLGTEAYPKESDYSQYILERGGQYNAFTKHDRTSYGFSVPSCAFSGALDRLSHFFINPLFTFSAIQREVHAVHHEFEDSIENDSLRVWRVLKESGNPKHPNSKLSCGNLESLSSITRTDIVSWFKTHYKPKQMRLVLMSHESLDVLAAKAHHFFSRIPAERDGEKKKEREVEMTTSQQRGSLIHVKPAFKNRSLFLMWEIPPSFLTLENSKSVQLVQMALDHGYSNSLSNLLEKESLAKEVHAEFWKITQDRAFFMINIVLTNQGISQYERVISRCFQALQRIKELGIPDYLLKRLQHIEASQLYSPFDSSFDRVMRVSSELLDEDIETYPDKTYTASTDSFVKISPFLEELNPFQCLYFLVASPEEVGIKMSRIEKWMGSEYVIRRINEDKLFSWSKEKPHPFIGFQPEEEMVPPKRDTPLVETEIEEKEVPDPVFVIDDARACIRWIEPSFEENSVDAFFCIETPLMSSSAKYMALNEIFIHRLSELLKEEFALDKEIVWNLEMEGMNLCMFLSVPSHRYFESFQRFFYVLKNISLSSMQFEQVKKEKLDSYPGDPSPIDYAHQILDSFLRPFYYTKMELYHALVDLDFEEYEAFQNAYFNEVFLEGTFLRGSDKIQSLELWEEISKILNAKPYNPRKDRAKQFVFPEESQSYLVLQKTHRKGNALLLLIEAGDSTLELESVYKVLTILLHSEFFEGLRTKQQTAYKLYTWSEMMNQKICHCFAVQSATHSPLDLLRRVELFLNDFSVRAADILTRERFEEILDTLISSGQKQKNSVEKIEDLAFVDESIESLKSLTYEQVLQKAGSVFSEENRRRIAILVEGSQQYPVKVEDFYSIPYLPIEKEKFHN